jgi:hypothetical protein
MYLLGYILYRFCDYFFLQIYLKELFCVQGVYVAGVVCYKCIGCIIDRLRRRLSRQ